MDLNTKITLDTAININKLGEAIEYYNNKDEHEKHLKDYMFESLVYRYKDALYKTYMIKSLYPIFQKWSATGSVYIISDTHFDDSDCKLMDPNWITPQEHMKIIKQDVRKGDTLIHLGDVGNPDYLDELKCYKVLITGNHDVLSKVASHFDEVYTGPLFIADRLILSHEPIQGLEDFAMNIHGHDHFPIHDKIHYMPNHINLASNVYHFRIFNLGASIKGGLLSQIENYHRITIDQASERKENNERS